MGQLQHVILGASFIFYVIAVARPKRRSVDGYGASREV
jgi:hypothetical protein